MMAYATQRTTAVVTTSSTASAAFAASTEQFKRGATGPVARQLTLAAALGLAIGLTTLAAPAWSLDRYVNPSNPAAKDMGYGTATAPWKTLAYAMIQIQPGDHLYIAPGTYRETMRLPNRTWSSASQTIIEGQGKVVIKASDVVTNWTSLGNNRYVTPLPKETAQVFINGKGLKQIGGNLFGTTASTYMWPARLPGDQNSMPLDSFYYDATTRNLYVRTSLSSLAGQTVEVSTRQYSLFGENLANMTVKNLSFTHGNASPTTRSGQVTLLGNKLTVQSLTVTWVDAVGLELNGNDNKLTDSVANYNGQVGIKARGYRNQLLRNITNYNNQRGFNKWWEAGGAKFTGSGGLRDSLVAQHTAIGNLGDGVWFDWENLNNRFENSVASDNTGFGLQYEASFGGKITNNYIVNNGQRGIYLPHSSDTVVAYNLVAGNKLQGIVVIDEGVRDKTGAFDLTPVGNKVFGNLTAFNGGALVLPGVLATNKSDANIYAGTAPQNVMRLGWGGALIDLPRWVALTGQDKRSRYINTAPSGTTSAAYINWGKSFRTTAGKLTVAPDWLALVPGPARDGYAGPQ